jgi:hypothetical protein
LIRRPIVALLLLLALVVPGLRYDVARALPAGLIVGAHLRNEPRLTAADEQRFVRAHLNGALAFYYQEPAQVRQLTDPANSIVRLSDSIVYWPQVYIPSAHDYALELSTEIHQWYSWGYTRFQVDNEPNYPGAWPARGQGAWQWAYFMREVIHELRGLTGDLCGLQLLATPMLADRNLSAEWYRAAEWVDPRYGASLVAMFDAIAVHSYWQAATDLSATFFGGNFTQLDDFRQGKDIYITEAGTSIGELAAYQDSAIIAQHQAAEYPAYLRFVSNYSYVKGVYFFILGSNGWTRFELSAQAADALARR